MQISVIGNIIAIDFLINAEQLALLIFFRYFLVANCFLLTNYRVLINNKRVTDAT